MWQMTQPADSESSGYQEPCQGERLPRALMLTDVRKLLDRLAERAGWARGEIRTPLFRHTYCAARRQTLDAGAPVSIYTVARELGHQSDEMVRRVYAHLGSTRHRSDVVEYRVAQHLDKLAGRLRKLGFVTGNVTGGVSMLETESPANTEVQAGDDVPEWARRDSNARPLAPERRPDRQSSSDGD
jgi:hypothetical protein